MKDVQDPLNIQHEAQPKEEHMQSLVREVLRLLDQQLGDRAQSGQSLGSASMKPPQNIKEVQRLTGCIAALGHFMSKFADKCQPLYCVLQRHANFMWDKEADGAFQPLKVYLAHLPKIASPVLGETLLLYVVILEQAVSVVLAVERAREQILVYYVSHALVGAKVNYPLIEKFAYTLVMASWKLRPYFEAHKVAVLTDQPFKNVLQRLDTSRRLLK